MSTETQQPEQEQQPQPEAVKSPKILEGEKRLRDAGDKYRQLTEGIAKDDRKALQAEDVRAARKSLKRAQRRLRKMKMAAGFIKRPLRSKRRRSKAGLDD